MPNIILIFSKYFDKRLTRQYNVCVSVFYLHKKNNGIEQVNIIVLSVARAENLDSIHRQQIFNIITNR